MHLTFQKPRHGRSTFGDSYGRTSQDGYAGRRSERDLVWNSVGTKLIADKPTSDAPSFDISSIENEGFTAVRTSWRSYIAGTFVHGILQK
jgi:hypothetical protein